MDLNFPSSSHGQAPGQAPGHGFDIPPMEVVSYNDYRRLLGAFRAQEAQLQSLQDRNDFLMRSHNDLVQRIRALEAPPQVFSACSACVTQHAAPPAEPFAPPAGPFSTPAGPSSSQYDAPPASTQYVATPAAGPFSAPAGPSGSQQLASPAPAGPSSTQQATPLVSVEYDLVGDGSLILVESLKEENPHLFYIH